MPDTRLRRPPSCGAPAPAGTGIAITGWVWFDGRGVVWFGQRRSLRGELNRQSELTTRFRLDCLDIRSEWAEARACRSQERFPL